MLPVPALPLAPALPEAPELPLIPAAPAAPPLPLGDGESQPIRVIPMSRSAATFEDETNTPPSPTRLCLVLCPMCFTGSVILVRTSRGQAWHNTELGATCCI